MGIKNKLLIFKTKIKELFNNIKNYVKKLITPWYLTPVKLISYTIFYIFKFILKFLIALFSLIIETIIYPFRSLKNFIKSIFYLAMLALLLFVGIVANDYIKADMATTQDFFAM